MSVIEPLDISPSYATEEEVNENYAKLSETFKSGRTKPIEFRKQQLSQLLKMMQNEKSIYEAIFNDLHKCREESILVETQMIENSIMEMIDKLDKWTGPQYVSRNPFYLFDDAHTVCDPLGLVVIFGAWNYPIQLSLLPMVGAIAAGNAVLLKPSEISTHSAKLLAEMIPKYLDNDAYKVLNGGVETSTLILKLKWDKIFYTGKTSVGKIMMHAAAENLSRITLELGGKTPVYVHNDLDMTVAARRIAWGKFMNAGQTCIAPDYVLCHESKVDEFCDEIIKAIGKFYTKEPQNFNQYGRIINKNHVKRLNNILVASKGNVVFGGEMNEDERYFAPTIVRNITAQDSLMQEEIFGPILPIRTIKSHKDAIDIINEGEKPLALYVFAKSCNVIADFRENTSSGGFLANDTMVHCGLSTLPFGGVGASGMGRYHGKYTFDTFCHEKAVLIKKPTMESLQNIRYPPISSKTAGKLYSMLLYRGKLFSHLSFIKKILKLFAIITLIVIVDRTLGNKLIETFL